MYRNEELADKEIDPGHRFATMCRNCNKVISKTYNRHIFFHSGKLFVTTKKSNKINGRTGYYCNSCYIMLTGDGASGK